MFVYIHGGYWQALSKETSAYCVDPLVENGCKVIIMNFELCPSVTVEQQINQSFESAKAILNYAAQMGTRFVLCVLLRHNQKTRIIYVHRRDNALSLIA